MKAPRSGKPWTPAEESRALDLRDFGWTYAEIGASLGRSEIAIEKKFERLDESAGLRREWLARREWIDFFGDHPQPVEVQT